MNLIHRIRTKTKTEFFRNNNSHNILLIKNYTLKNHIYKELKDFNLQSIKLIKKQSIIGACGSLASLEPSDRHGRICNMMEVHCKLRRLL